MQETADTTKFVNLDTYAANRGVQGTLVTVLASTHESRGLKLIKSFSRALPKYSIHELIATDEDDAQTGGTVQKIAYLGFFEVTRGGCLIIGDELKIGAKKIGKVLGFDETHQPNHINIIIAVNQRKTGEQLHLKVNDSLQFKMVKR